MKVLFYFGHPAHFHLFKNLIQLFQQRGDEVLITIKKKDVLEDLLTQAGLPYINVYEKSRKKNYFSILIALIQKDFRILQIARRFKPDYLAGTSIEITHVGRLIGKPAYIFNEDDADYVKEFVLLGYPFAKKIFIPNGVNAGKWESKCIRYNGVQKLAYLHPNYFKPNPDIVESIKGKDSKFALIRLSGLNAYHDKGIKGFTIELLRKIITILNSRLRVFISTEKDLPDEFDKYLLKTDPANIHHFLHFAHLFIGDSQSMSIEAALLGTYTIRFTGFIGKISVMYPFEKMGLIKSISAVKPNELIETINSIDDFEALKIRSITASVNYIKTAGDVTNFFFKNLPNG